MCEGDHATVTSEKELSVDSSVRLYLVLQRKQSLAGQAIS